jgi:arylsulfatase A-like enzyme
VVVSLAAGFVGWLASRMGGSESFARCGTLAVPAVLLSLTVYRSPVRESVLAANAGLAVVAALCLPGLALSLTRRRRPRVATGLIVGLCAVEALFVSRHLGGRWERPIRLVAAGPVLDQRPNILLITLDTLRADHLSFYGYPKETAPHLRRLATDALVFDRAYAASPYTLASHASLFTGLLPGAHGAHPMPFTVHPVAEPESGAQVGDYSLPAEATTLAEDLRQRGYRTGAIVANGAYLARWTDLDQGFEYYDSNTSSLRIAYAPLVIFVARRLSPPLFERMTYGPQWHAHQITAAAERWLQDIGEEPSFLFLNYLEPHAPYSVNPNDLAAFGPGFSCEGIVFAKVEEDVQGGGRDILPRERDCLVAQYDAEIHIMDTQLGRLFDWLQSRGRLASTLVVVTADHGEHFGEHGLVAHDNGLYEEVLRVPLVIRDPRHRGGARRAEPVSLLDLRDLIVAYADQRGSVGLELRGSPAPRVLAEHWTRERQRRQDPQRFCHSYSRAIYAFPFKLIDEGSSGRLYDLSRDPVEAIDLLAGGARDAQEQRRRLVGAVPPAPVQKDGPPAAVADPEALERLRALGYVE